MFKGRELHTYVANRQQQSAYEAIMGERLLESAEVSADG